MIYNDNIRTFVDISHHLELEDELFQATNLEDETLITKYNARPCKAKYCCSKKFQKKGSKSSQQSSNPIKKDIDKHAKKKSKDIYHVTYYNWGKKGHYTNTCTTLKKAQQNTQ